MSLSGTTFRWLDILEAEFDRAFVELDMVLNDVDPDISHVAATARHKMTTLCSAFAQLTDKAQTIFQTNAKLEAQICDIRQNLVESQAQRDMIDQEHRKLLFELHESQLLNAKSRMEDTGPETEAILRSLTNGKDAISPVSLKEARLSAEAVQLRKENLQLREWLVEIQNELFGAHLAASYLDKELAGRIQQIQLLARDLRGEEHDHLWNHIEAEVNLHRHKTIIQACRRRSRVKSKQPRDNQSTNGDHNSESQSNHHEAGVIRHVEIYKEAGESLGLSVTGGQEHGVPILISEIHEGHLAARSGAFLVGDAVLSVNGIDLRRAKHTEAVKIFSQCSQGNMSFELLFIELDSEDDESVDNFEFQREESQAGDSLRALNARSASVVSSASGTNSRCSLPKRLRFPGHALEVTQRTSDTTALPGSSTTL